MGIWEIFLEEVAPELSFLRIGRIWAERVVVWTCLVLEGELQGRC